MINFNVYWFLIHFIWVFHILFLLFNILLKAHWLNFMSLTLSIFLYILLFSINFIYYLIHIKIIKWFFFLLILKSGGKDINEKFNNVINVEVLTIWKVFLSKNVIFYDEQKLIKDVIKNILMGILKKQNKPLVLPLLA